MLHGLQHVCAFTGGYTFGSDNVFETEVPKAGALANAASKATTDAMQGVIHTLTARLSTLSPDNAQWTVP